MHFFPTYPFPIVPCFYLEILVLPRKLAAVPASGVGNVTWASSKLQVWQCDLDSVQSHSFHHSHGVQTLIFILCWLSNNQTQHL